MEKKLELLERIRIVTKKRIFQIYIRVLILPVNKQEEFYYFHWMIIL